MFKALSKTFSTKKKLEVNNFNSNYNDKHHV